MAERTTATRWAGVSADRRRADRRKLLVDAAFELFGTEDGAGVTVRAVCRAAELNTRYFYESFEDTDGLLAAVYDGQAELLAERLAAAQAAATTAAARMREGIRCVLRFVAEDPRRGAVLFTGARANDTLAGRRRRAVGELAGGAVVAQQQAGLTAGRAGDEAGPRRAAVAAAMFAGAMAELVQQWLDGRLGTDVEAVVDDAVALSEAMFTRAMDAERAGADARVTVR